MRLCTRRSNRGRQRKGDAAGSQSSHRLRPVLAVEVLLCASVAVVVGPVPVSGRLGLLLDLSLLTTAGQLEESSKKAHVQIF